MPSRAGRLSPLRVRPRELRDARPVTGRGRFRESPCNHRRMAVDDRAVELWFRIYLGGFIGNDMTAAIRGRANYGAALMLVCYTEYIGGISTGLLTSPRTSRRTSMPALRCSMPWRRPSRVALTTTRSSRSS